VMIESGLAAREIGKLILAACFVTDLGTVLFLGLLFANVSPLLIGFGAATAIALFLVPRLLRWLGARVPNRVSEPEIKFLFFVLLLLGGLARIAGSEAVLPAYLIGLAIAGVFVGDRILVHRMRATAFSLLTPFYFLKAGSLVSLPAVAAGAGVIGLFLAVKVGAKIVGVWPTARAFGMPTRDANYTTLLMSTGLTFGTIAALYGLTNGYIDATTYSVLVTVVILSAVVPTLLATRFFEPRPVEADAFEDFDAAEEIDAGPIAQPRRAEGPTAGSA
jgi:Kef-type K+ transport system membrane component KefB